MQFIDKKIEDYCSLRSTRPSSDCTKIENYTRANVDIPQMLIGEIEGGDADTTAIQKFNDAIAADTTLEKVLLPVRDGLCLVRKK